MVLYNWRPCLIWQWLEWTKLKVTGGWLAGSTVDRVRSGPGVMTTTHANRRGSSIQVENSGSTTSLSGKFRFKTEPFSPKNASFSLFLLKKCRPKRQVRKWHHRDGGQRQFTKSRGYSSRIRRCSFITSGNNCNLQQVFLKCTFTRGSFWEVFPELI